MLPRLNGSIPKPPTLKNLCKLAGCMPICQRGNKKNLYFIPFVVFLHLFLLLPGRKTYSLWMKRCLRSGKTRKKAKFFLLLICGPIPRAAYLVFHNLPPSRWGSWLRLEDTGEGGYLKSRGGRQDRVGGDKLLAVDWPLWEFWIYSLYWHIHR